MADTLLWKYGSFTHLPGEVVDARYSKKRHLTRRGMTDTDTINVKLIIEAVGCGWEAIKARENLIIAAYEQQGKRLSLVYPDNTESKCIIGTSYWGPDYIIIPACTHVTYPTHANEEMINKRHIEVDIEALVEDTWNNQIIEWNESVRHVGLAGPVYVDQPTLSGIVTYELWPTIPQYIVQEGSAIGMEGYVLLNIVPMLPLSEELWHLRELTTHAPLTQPLAYYYYKTEWKFTFRTFVPVTLFPAFPP